MYVRQWSIVQDIMQGRECIQKFDAHAMNLQSAASEDRQAGLQANYKAGDLNAY